MPRPATGNIERYEWKDGRTVSWRLRVRFNGARYRIDLGTNHEGWGQERAQVRLDQVLGEIERGTWRPPTEQAITVEPSDETLHVTLSRFWHRRCGEWEPNTLLDYRWRADHILRSDIIAMPTRTIRVADIDDLSAILTGRKLSARSVNMVLGFLAQVLDDALDYELLEVNPARGARRRKKVPPASRAWLEPDMVIDMLDVAGEWEASVPPHQRYGRRALLAALAAGGPRIVEILEAPRGGLDARHGELRLGAKTAAGRERLLELSAFLAAELREHADAVRPELLAKHGATLPLFHSSRGRQLNASNIRNRLLAEVVRRTNEKRAAEGRLLLPAKVTPHALRRTFASLCCFAGRDLKWTMGQLGHDDPRMTLAVYAQGAQRRRVDNEAVWRLMRFVDEPETWAAYRGLRSAIGPRIGPAEEDRGD